MAKKQQLYQVTERKRGGKRRRYTNEGQKMSKADAEGFAKAMRKLFSDSFVYRVVKAK